MRWGGVGASRKLASALMAIVSPPRVCGKCLQATVTYNLKVTARSNEIADASQGPRYHKSASFYYPYPHTLTTPLSISPFHSSKTQCPQTHGDPYKSLTVYCSLLLPLCSLHRSPSALLQCSVMGQQCGQDRFKKKEGNPLYLRERF